MGEWARQMNQKDITAKCVDTNYMKWIMREEGRYKHTGNERGGGGRGGEENYGRLGKERGGGVREWAYTHTYV